MPSADNEALIFVIVSKYTRNSTLIKSVEVIEREIALDEGAVGG